MVTKQKRDSRFNFKKVFASLFILVILLITSVIIITDSVKADYVDESTTDDSYIAWLTLYDTTGAVIINWTSVNDDVSPNVNSQNTKVGYWSVGIYINETDATYFTYPQEAISLMYLQFSNMTASLSWYANSENMAHYFSSYHDYGGYDIVVLKTPDWAEQMKYDWWRLDDTLKVNASLYINNGYIEVRSDHPQEGTNDTVSASYYGPSLIDGRTAYTSINNNVGAVSFSYSSPNYSIRRQYVFVHNYYETTNATKIRLGWTPWNPGGDSSSIIALVYSLPVNSDAWDPAYWQYTNWGPNPIAQIYPDELSTIAYVDIPKNATYGDYILIMFIVAADFDGLGVTSGSDYTMITSLQDYYVKIQNSVSIESYSFIGTVVNHEQFSLDARSIVWLLIGLLPALILGYFIGRPGVIAGLAIMALVNGYSQPNYFWVMALTLGVCAIMLYKGGIK